MPDIVEAAPSGRAKCRGCGTVIEKGSLRFGEAVPNAYGEGESRLWFHPVCAACMRPEKFSQLLKVHEGELPERATLERLAEAGVQFPRLARICRGERDPSGRARCRHCKELMEKGSLRIALQLLEESRFQPIGFIHLSCAFAYFARQAEEQPEGSSTTEALPTPANSSLASTESLAQEILERIVRFTPNLDSAEREAISQILHA
ncbi:MAG: hypothetical protein SFV15_20070 [Polyangiaceae bacterium]|nr:hypothetical protein [Polyangiaceae bacterium]